MAPGPASTLRGQREAGLLCTTGQQQLFPLPLCGSRRQCATPSNQGDHRNPDPLSLSPGSCHAQAGGLGGIITNAFIDSTVSRACPCVSNAHAAINRHSVDSRCLRDCIQTTWSMDFVSDALFDGRRQHRLTAIDLYTRECLEICAI
nr:transposase [Edwardsiella sp. EA181011]